MTAVRLTHQPDTLIALHILFYYENGIVGRTVVANNEFPMWVALLKDTFDALADVVRVVIVGEQYGYQGLMRENTESAWLKRERR